MTKILKFIKKKVEPQTRAELRLMIINNLSLIRSQEVPIAHVRNRTLVNHHVPQIDLNSKLLRRENGQHLELTLL